MCYQFQKIVFLAPILLLIIGCNYSEAMSSESAAPTNTAMSEELPTITAPVVTQTATNPPALPTSTPTIVFTNTPMAVPSETPSTQPTAQILPEELDALTGLIICNRQGEFFVVDESGNPVNQSATFMGDEFLPHLNDNIYFIQQSDVWVRNKTTGQTWPLMETPDVDEQLIYGFLGEWLLIKLSSGEIQNQFQSPGPISLLKLDGSEYQLLVDDSIIGVPLLSTDGKFAIISTATELLLIDEDLAQTSPFDQQFYFGAISPDNQYIAHNGSQIGVSEMSTGDLWMEFVYQGALTVGDIPPQPFQWSPNNEWVAIETFNMQVEPPAVPNQLLVLNLTTGESQTVSNGWNPRWSPDGKILVFATNPRSPYIQLLRVSETPAVVVDTGYEGLPARWTDQNNVQVNNPQNLPVECESQ
ncbi:MAG: hypothetical protein HND44_02880 [Chloroflexi bacterium]|nr:PD40 domain-containing protein [Ardenticatenaceae bacterium]MBL1127443.1 hypothetical protein [Chloroflexota bacterium]NOG33506.1 hypothetical protein [Chloroflexota bacterium]